MGDVLPGAFSDKKGVAEAQNRGIFGRTWGEIGLVSTEFHFLATQTAAKIAGCPVFTYRSRPYQKARKFVFQYFTWFLSPLEPDACRYFFR